LNSKYNSPIYIGIQAQLKPYEHINLHKNLKNKYNITQEHDAMISNPKKWIKMPHSKLYPPTNI
jgi:hypothetical protein